MTGYIAIDGGGSGCRAVYKGRTGGDRLALAGPANAFTDLDGTAQTLTALVQDLTQGAPIPPITAGIAGCRLPSLSASLTQALPFPAHIVDDSVTTAHGAFGRRDGTLISLGTGSFFLRKSGGEVRHIGGWGFQLGDRASGAWFGRMALEAALRAADGQAPRDALTDRLMDPHPLLHTQNAGPAAFAALAPLVFELSDTATAQHLIDLAIAEIDSALTALDTPPEDPIVLIGGLAEPITPHLPERLKSRLTQPLGTPLDGACALAEARGL